MPYQRAQQTPRFRGGALNPHVTFHRGGRGKGVTGVDRYRPGSNDPFEKISNENLSALQ